MGGGGSCIARAQAAADIVLNQEGLGVIIDAILRSRKIFQRMRNYCIYRIACTLQLLFFFFFAIMTVRVRAGWCCFLTPLSIPLSLARVRADAAAAAEPERAVLRRRVVLLVRLPRPVREQLDEVRRRVRGDSAVFHAARALARRYHDPERRHHDHDRLR